LQTASMDGHLPPQVGPAHVNRTCIFDARVCLPMDFFTNPKAEHSATDMFTQLAFAEPECGDCLITALIAASGSRGLSAILPTKEQTFVPPRREKQRWERSEPMLPLESVWTGADFSLEAVVRPGQDTWDGTAKPRGEVSLRDWSIKLLSRYAYLTG
jgi:3-O-alpha-D-mannopyranosyl-alpha-D-mannopyranose xylosylphosphotransferase